MKSFPTGRPTWPVAPSGVFQKQVLLKQWRGRKRSGLRWLVSKNRMAFATQRTLGHYSVPSKGFHLGRFCRRWKTCWSFFLPLVKKNPVRIGGALQNLRRPKSRQGGDLTTIGRTARANLWSPEGAKATGRSGATLGGLRKQPDFWIAGSRSQSSLHMAGRCEPPRAWQRAHGIGRWS